MNKTITVKVPVSPATKDVEIALPFYRKEVIHTITEYFGAIDENNFVRAYVSDNFTLISTSSKPVDLDQLSKKFAEWEVIDEDEFLAAHAKVLASLSLIPQLKESNDDIPKTLFTHGSLPDPKHTLAQDIKR